MTKSFRVFHGDVDADGALTSRRANVVLQKRLQLYCINTYDDDDDKRRRLSLRRVFFGDSGSVTACSPSRRRSSSSCPPSRPRRTTRSGPTSCRTGRTTTSAASRVSFRQSPGRSG